MRKKGILFCDISENVWIFMLIAIPFILGYCWGYMATVPYDGAWGKNINDLFYEENGAERKMLKAFFGENMFHSKRWKNIQKCIKKNPVEVREHLETW